MRAKEEAFRILEAALSIASTGVDEAEVSLGGGELGMTSFGLNQLGPAIDHAHEVLAIRASKDGRMCRVQTNDLSTSGIKEAAQEARTKVDHLPAAAKGAGLPEPQSYELTEAYDPETDATKTLDRTMLASRALMAAHKGDLYASGLVAVRRGSVGLDGSPGTYAVANTRGLLAYHPATRVTFSVDMSRSGGLNGFAEDESYSISGIDPQQLVSTAVKKASLGAEAQRIGPGVYTAVLEPAAVGALMVHLGRTAGAARMHAGASFLSGRIGEKVADASVTIIDDYAHPLLRGTPFDVEGVARMRVPIIEEGVAKGPVYSWDSAIRFEAQATGHRVVDPYDGEVEHAQNLVMSGGDATFSDLLGGVESGVLIGRITNVTLLDPRRLIVTGMTSGGFFLVDHGDLTVPLSNMRVTVSLLDLLAGIEGMTGSAWAEGSVVPALRAQIPLT